MNRTPSLAATEIPSTERAVAELQRVRDEIGKIIIGQQNVIEGVLVCLIAGGPRVA